MCVLLTACTSSPALADWQFTPFIGITFTGDTTIVDLEDGASAVHWNFGGSAALLGSGPLGAEALFVYTRGFFDREELTVVGSNRSLALMGNVVLTTPERWNPIGPRPFLSGGLGLLNASQEQLAENPFPVSENLLAWNLGGGLVGPLTESTGLRFDLRYFSNLRKTEATGTSLGRVRLNYWTGTIGIMFRY